MDADRRYTTGVNLAAGGLTAAMVPHLANQTKRDFVAVRARSKLGTGALDARGRPVDPTTLSAHRGTVEPDGSRRPSPRHAARLRHAEASQALHRSYLKPAIGARTARGLKVGGVMAGLAGAGVVGHTAYEQRKVRKDVYDSELVISPQLGVGIPATRTNPISPLAMSVSSGIMADFIVGATGKRLTRKEKKAVRQGAYGFAGARGMLFSPLGFGRSNSA